MQPKLDQRLAQLLVGEAEITAVNADGSVVLSFDELKLMHELEAEDKSKMMYPSMGK